MNIFCEDLIRQIKKRGADLVGIANLSALHELSTGIAVAVAVPPNVIRSIHNGPTMEYYDAYNRINACLNDIVTFGAQYLTDNGYTAYAQTTEIVEEYGNYRTTLPHKTVATRAGLGWIGKCALLVTEDFGSAIRISSLVTNADLPCGEPIDDSRCGDCDNCRISCPGDAVIGELWRVGVDRDSLFDPVKCKKAARNLAAEKIDREITLCGKCIEVCPYTQRYLSKSAHIV